MLATWKQALPWRLARDGVKSLARAVAVHTEDSLDRSRWLFADVAASDAGASRFPAVTTEGMRDRVVAGGGRWQFGEHCPDGCLAVEYAGPADIGRATPFRPELLRAAVIAEAQYEKTLGASSDEVIQPFYMSSYPNGDLLATFYYADFHFPSFAGVARLDRAGRPIWYRRDYSHHEPHVAAGDTALVPGLKFEDEVELPGNLATWRCRPHATYVDVVDVLDPDGGLVERISVLDAFLASPWASVLTAADPCDPFHLNSVSLVRDDVSGLGDVRPGDIVLSLKHLSAVAILDRRTHALKRYVRGTFSQQHSVKHLRGSNFVMFDNRGGYGGRRGERYPYSRALVVDLATGEETVVFPKSGSERYGNWHSLGRGRISVSPRGDRMLASYTRLGRAVEVRIEDGEVLAEFNLLHDMRKFGRADGRAIHFQHGNLFYVREASR